MEEKKPWMRKGRRTEDKAGVEGRKKESKEGLKGMTGQKVKKKREERGRGERREHICVSNTVHTSLNTDVCSILMC